MPTPNNYWDYLHLEQLLSLQGGLEGDEASLMPDELHFIVVHQTLELWFKLVLRELRLARDHLAEPKVPEEQVPYVVHHLRRVNAILRLAIEHFQVMETLTPQDFLGFRDKLVPASGFQSYQMREIELLLGLRQEHRVRYGTTDALEHIRDLAKDSPGGDVARARVEAALGERSLRSALHAWLFRTPIQGSSPGDADDDVVVARFVRDYLDAVAARSEVQLGGLVAAGVGDAAALRERFAQSQQAAESFLMADDAPEAERATQRRARAGLVFIESYRDLPLLAWPRTLIDTVVELEELMVLFRTRHARMVERIIGRRVGTGGSSGVEYLDRTTQLRIFTELWTVRTLLLPRDAVPPLARAEGYGFAS